MKGVSSPRNRAAKLLGGVTFIQATFFLFVVREPGTLLLATTVLSTLWFTAMFAMPRLRYVENPGSSMPVWGGQWLSALVLALAVFKIATRNDVYLNSLMDGFSFARQLMDSSALSGGSMYAIVNVFLTPLWINLIAERGDRRYRLSALDCVAISIVPAIALLDMLLFGGRVTFAFMMVLLYVAGVLRFRTLAWVGIFFVVAFTYVQALRSPEFLETGFDYLTHTASGGTLPPLRDLDAIGLSTWLIGPLMFAQYAAHPISEFLYLISELPWWNPNFSMIKDQFAALGLGDRVITQNLLEQFNPRFGTYQTFFGPFLIDFGLAGIGVAMAAWVIIIGLARCTRGHPRKVIALLVLSNIAVAPIENFFIMGGGFSQSILAVFLAFLFSCRIRGVTRV